MLESKWNRFEPCVLCLYLLPVRSKVMHVTACVLSNSETRRPLSKSQTLMTWDHLEIMTILTLHSVDKNKTRKGRFYWFTVCFRVLRTDVSLQLTTWRNSSQKPQQITGSSWEIMNRPGGRGLSEEKKNEKQAVGYLNCRAIMKMIT